MKKLLVILISMAGFVTVASADSLECAYNTTNQCCGDVYDMLNTISQAKNLTITTKDGYRLQNVGTTLVNYAEDNCIDGATYLNKEWAPILNAEFQWKPGSWASTIKYYGPSPSANKSDAIITNN